MLYKLLDLLGCTPLYRCKILSEPIPIEDYWEYKIMPLYKKYRVFGIIVFTKKLDYDKQK